MSVVYNKGKREWRFTDSKKEKALLPGEKREYPKAIAQKYNKLYPGEFEIIETEEEKSSKRPIERPIEISDPVKNLIKETQGISIKGAAKLFEEKEAYEEAEQLEIIEEFKGQE
jgi:hypothetical protein